MYKTAKSKTTKTLQNLQKGKKMAMKNLQTKLAKQSYQTSQKTPYTNQAKLMLTIVFISVFGLSGCFGYKALPSVKNPPENPTPQKCPKVQQIVIGLLDDTPCEDCAQKDGIKELEKPLPTKNPKKSKNTTQESNTDESSTSESNPTNNALGITQDESEQALLAGLNDLCQELEEMYVVSLRYGSDLVESTSKGTFVATSIKQASVRLELEFIPDFFNGERKRFSARANAQMEIKSKKVLEIGKRVNIEPKDKAYLVRKAMDSAIKEISKGIKRASASSQNPSSSPAKATTKRTNKKKAK